MAWTSLRTIKEQEKQDSSAFRQIFIAFCIIIALFFVTFIIKRKINLNFYENKQSVDYSISEYKIYGGRDFAIAAKNNGVRGTLYGVMIRDEDNVYRHCCFNADNVIIETRQVDNCLDAYISFETDGSTIGDEFVFHIPENYIIVYDNSFFKDAVFWKRDTSMMIVKEFGQIFDSIHE